MAASVEEEEMLLFIDGFKNLLKNDESILMDFILANKLELEAIDSVAELVDDYSNNDAMRLVFCREIQRIHPQRAHEFVKRFNVESKFPPQQVKLELHLSMLLREQVFGHFTRYPADAIVVCAHLLQRGEHLLIEKMQVDQHILNQVLQEFHLKLDLERARKQRDLLQLTCLQLPAHVQVTVISTLDGLRAAKLAFDLHSPVGVDVEWFPYGQPQAEVVQIAQENQVFLFDFGKRSLLFIDRFARAELNACLLEYLSRVPKVIMFGDGVSDFKAIRNRHAQLQFTSALRGDNKRIKMLSNPGGGGLSDFVARRLGGKPLNKDMQQSNWRNRPWSKDQIHYAALDAWVLLSL